MKTTKPFKTVLTTSIASFLMLFTVVFAQNNQAQIQGLESVYCISPNSPTQPVQMTGIPAGGTFTGPGVLPGNMFLPIVAGPGVHTIKYEVISSNGAVLTATKEVTVKMTPQAQITGFQNSGGPGIGNTVCQSAPPITLQGTPPTGQFSGPGITPGSAPGTAIFNPANLPLGQVTITYAGTFEGCPFTATTLVFIVDAPPIPMPNLPDVMCETSQPVPLITTGGTQLTWSGPGVVADSATGMTVFNPQVAGPGTHYISYTGQMAGCTIAGGDTITVQEAVEAQIGGIENGQIICKTHAPIQLTLIPAGGTLVGPGIEGTIFNPGSPMVQPGPVTITYNSGFGGPGTQGCPYSVSVTVKIVQGVEAHIQGLEGNYCVTAPPATMTGNPAGGSFKIDSVTINGNQFNPAIWGVGPHIVTYFGVTDGGCQYSRTKLVNVTPAPQANITNLNETYCNTAEGIQMNGTPQGGKFSINGEIINNSQFKPSVWGIGTHTVKYYGVFQGCEYATTKTVTVVSSNIVVTASQVNPSCQVCPNGSITVMATGGTEPYKYRLNDQPAQTNPTFSNLVGGTYKIRVRDAAGCEGEIIITLTAPPACPAPANIVVTTNAPGNYIVTWTAVQSAINYTLRYRPINSDNWTMVNVNGTARELSGLNPQQEYEVQVRARCVPFGNGSYSQSVIFGGSNSTTNCPAPTGIFVTNVAETSALVKWQAVTGATSYQLQYRLASGGTWQTVTSPATSYTINGLWEGYTYVVRVRTICGNNTSLWSTPVVEFTTQNGTRYGAFEMVDFNLYPNPNKGNFTLTFSAENSTAGNISIMDLSGRIVANQMIDVFTGNNELSLNFELKTGVYLLKVSTGSEIRTVKLLVE